MRNHRMRLSHIDDFMQDAVGDFPGGWDTNASGEIV